MDRQPRILAFAGSTRSGSYNKKLVRIAAEGARRSGAEVTFVDLRDLALPLYDEDLEKEKGLPEGAKRLKMLMSTHDGFLIASPEYNSSISAVLKNAIDWATRKAEPNEPPLSAFAGKVAVIMSASPGALGGLRGLVHLRAILGNINVIVLPDQRAVPKAHEAFNGDGTLKDAELQMAIESLGETAARFARRLVG